VAFNPNYWKANFTLSWTGSCGALASTSIVWVGVSAGGNYVQKSDGSLLSVNSSATSGFTSVNGTGGASEVALFLDIDGRRGG